ncbi:dynein axonemal light chain 1-like isoform X3 [Athalia rosae]|uniref:dynein axonemal light chain 1-like isoform X3 n=1 Tax=Athalia rosae TaxID=37344 RepID=UPI0020344BE9|nr:dynein axonemal light chain 1-like isoform X3 [Athalia rosae]
MSRATSCKEAIQRWEDQTGEQASEKTEMYLNFQWPPIDRMDNSLGALVMVEKLSLSTNMIDKISGINALKNLKILSLGRNYIKTFSGLETVGDHLEELWISYNMIEKIKGVNVLKALKDLLFVNNPICENMDVETWRAQVTRRLPALKILDAIPIVLVIQFFQNRNKIQTWEIGLIFFLQAS